MSTSNQEEITNIMENVSTSFNPLIVKDILKSQYTHPKTKISNEAVELIAELAKVITVEAALRAAKKAVKEGGKTVVLDNSKNIVNKMMIDFP